MPIDPKGTSPQPPQTQPRLEEVAMKCRKCDSITAYVIPIKNPAIRMYRCTSCHNQWGLNVGGHLDI